MQIGPGNAILEPYKTEKVSTQFQMSQLLVISLCSITKSVPDPLFDFLWRLQVIIAVSTFNISFFFFEIRTPEHDME